MNLGKPSTGGSKQLWTGFASMKCVSINPSKGQLSELLGFDLTDKNDKEIEYELKSKKGDEMILLSFWLEADTPDKQLFNAKFYLVDKEMIFEKSGKQQWVNQSGAASPVKDEKDLQIWFTHFLNKEKEKIGDKKYRESIQGESGFYEFLRCWLGKVNFWGKDEDGNFADILIDKKKMFRNVDKYVETEFRPLIDSEYVTNITALATVHSYNDKDGELKHAQNVGYFIPATIKDGSRYSSSISVIRVAAGSGNWASNEFLKKYVEQLVGEHGTKDSYTLTMLQPFDPSNHQQAGNEVFKVSEEGVNENKADDTSY